MCIPEFIADRVHSQKDLWRIDIGNLTGFFIQYGYTCGTLWFPFDDAILDEEQISEWNINFSQNHDAYDVGIVIVDGKWSLAQNFDASDAVDNAYEKLISWQRHIYSIINNTLVQK